MTPFRLALVSAAVLFLATPVFAQNATQQIDVALTNFAFTPDALTLKLGTPYRLHLVNSGSSNHNFAAADFFATVTVASPDASKVQDGAIEVPKNTTVDVTVTPTKAGTYDLTCSHFMHTTFGMKGQIVVQ
jgi:uncharacterized cupredoxin-like copper-binding protein